MRPLSPVLSLLLLLLALPIAAAERAPVVSVVAGIPGVTGSNDGGVREATFNRPTWLDIVAGDGPLQSARSGDIFVIDRGNDVIRRISGPVVTTLAPTTGFPAAVFPFDFGGPFGGGILVEPAGAGCGAGAYDRGIFVSSSGTNQIVHVSPAGVLAARDDVSPFVNAYGQFSAPTGIGRSWRYPNFNDLRDRALYIADTGTHTIRRVGFSLSFEACPQHKFVTTFAGTPGVAGSSDRVPVTFNSPRGVAGAPDGSVYVTDTGNHTIRRIAPDGSVTTVAGEPGIAGDVDGRAGTSRLNSPSGIDVNEDGDVFIADTGNQSVRVLRAGVLTTIVKTHGPVGLKVAPDGSIFIAEPADNVIRRITFPGARGRVVRR